MSQSSIASGSTTSTLLRKRTDNLGLDSLLSFASTIGSSPPKPISRKAEERRGGSSLHEEMSSKGDFLSASEVRRLDGLDGEKGRVVDDVVVDFIWG
jgi:hypothetical protein